MIVITYTSYSIVLVTVNYAIRQDGLTFNVCYLYLVDNNNLLKEQQKKSVKDIIEGLLLNTSLVPYQPKQFVNNKCDNRNLFNIPCILFNSESLQIWWKNTME